MGDVMLSDIQKGLLQILADGACHSGESLGRALGVSRAAIWKHVQQLKSMGVALQSEVGQGYTVGAPMVLLDSTRIKSALSPAMESHLSRMVCETVVPSTNDYLLQALSSSELSSGAVCLAEMQTGGKGRRGRRWVGEFGRNMMLSVAWRFDGGVSAIGGLSLAVGVVIAQVLQRYGVEGLSLKWPNDLLVGRCKLGGILVEVGGDASGDCFVVVGVGLNLDLSSTSGDAIDQPWVDLKSLAVEVDRNVFIGECIDALLRLLSSYEDKGFSFYRKEWLSRGAFVGESVCVSSAQNIEEGVLMGVSESGGLLVQGEGGVREFLGGEVSLRESL